jgi:hypothetical protein
MARSPAHYRESLESTWKPSAAMELGSAVHALVLGGPDVVAYPGAVRRGKEWDGFKAEHEGDLILLGADYEKAQRMADAVGKNANARRVLEGRREQPIDWSIGSRACRSTPDVVGNGFVTELKTTNTAEPARFQWQALRMAYHAQLAFYLEAVRSSAAAEQPQEAYIVAVESSAPFPVTVLRLTNRALDQGARMFRLWFERLLTCEASGVWPGYCEAIVDLDVPDEDMELTFGEETI